MSLFQVLCSPIYCQHVEWFLEYFRNESEWIFKIMSKLAEINSDNSNREKCEGSSLGVNIKIFRESWTL